MADPGYPSFAAASLSAEAEGGQPTHNSTAFIDLTGSHT